MDQYIFDCGNPKCDWVGTIDMVDFNEGPVCPVCGSDIMMEDWERNRTGGINHGHKRH